MEYLLQLPRNGVITEGDLQKGIRMLKEPSITLTKAPTDVSSYNKRDKRRKKKKERRLRQKEQRQKAVMDELKQVLPKKKKVCF